jgi:hypothetical protein
MRDSLPFVAITRTWATSQEASDFAHAIPALIELATLVKAGRTTPATLQRLAGMALDRIEGKLHV